MPAADLDSEFSGCWLPVRRFGIRQGDKVRAVDDFSEGGHNSALSACETVAPSDLDDIAGAVRAHMAGMAGDLSLLGVGDPKHHNPKRHLDHRFCQLQGRLWDLAKAYRQLARSPGHGSLTIVAAWDPVRKETCYYRQVAMAFGASSSVLGFNWVASALSLCLVKLLFMSSTNFYDDFTVLELESLTASATETTDAFFEILGWELKPMEGFTSMPGRRP